MTWKYRYTGIYFQVMDPARKLTGEQWNLEKEMGVCQMKNGIVYRTWKTTGYHHGDVSVRSSNETYTRCSNR